MSKQNRSTAVMQRRSAAAPDTLDYFPTPPWATRALLRFLKSAEMSAICGGRQYPLELMSAWEPACGELHMSKVLKETFPVVRASDVFDYGGHEVIDFLSTGFTEPDVDWVFSNPPFKLAQEFIELARRKAKVGTAMLLRGAFLEGQDRYRELFALDPPTVCLQFVERVCMLEKRLVRAGEIDPFAIKPGTKVSSATAYMWFVWIDGFSDSRIRWIPPCRKELERPGDYPDYDGETRESLGLAPIT